MRVRYVCHFLWFLYRSIGFGELCEMHIFVLKWMWRTVTHMPEGWWEWSCMVELVRVSDEGFGTRILPETLQLFQTIFKQHGVQRGFCDHARWRMSLRDKDSDDDVCKSSAGPGRAFPISLESLIQMKKHVITFCRISNCDARWHTFPRDNDESNDVYELVQMSCKKAIAPRIFLNPYRSDVQAKGYMHPWLWCTVTHILERQGQWCM